MATCIYKVTPACSCLYTPAKIAFPARKPAMCTTRYKSSSFVVTSKSQTITKQCWQST